MDCFKLGLDKTASHQTVKPPSASLTCEHRVRPIRVHTLGVTLERSKVTKVTGTLDGHDVTEKLHRSGYGRYHNTNSKTDRTISENTAPNQKTKIGKWKAEIKKRTQEKSKKRGGPYQYQKT